MRESDHVGFYRKFSKKQRTSEISKTVAQKLFNRQAMKFTFIQYSSFIHKPYLFILSRQGIIWKNVNDDLIVLTQRVHTRGGFSSSISIISRNPKYQGWHIIKLL